MRCLVVADLHYALSQYDWVMDVADRFDVVVIAGDHLDLSSLVDWRAQTVVIRKYIDRLRARTRLIICSGNHDLDFKAQSGEKIAKWIQDFRFHGLPVDGESTAFDDTLVTVCPWWDGPVTRDRIAAQIAEDAAKRPGTWIWVHHAPPDKSATSWGGTRHYGDTALAEWIAEYAPDIVLCGHVHQSPFCQGGSWADRIGKTWVFNAGHQFGAPPAHIVLDTERRAAAWISAAGAQAVELDEPLERPIPRLAELPGWFTAGDRNRPDRIPA